MVLELASVLHLDDWETRQLLEASLTALAPSWYIPFPRNPLFTGREEVLRNIHEHVQVDQANALFSSYALQGLGGIGKTQTVLEYAYRHSQDYSAIFWVQAETLESITGSILQIADLLRLPERQGAKQQQVVAAVEHWLGQHRDWLLIWDNVEDVDMLHRFLPSARNGTILLTTRCQALGTLAQGIELTPLSSEEGQLFLLRRTKLVGPTACREQMHHLTEQAPEEYAASQELVRLLDGLPLALDQVGAYVEETRCSLAHYLHSYERHRGQLLARRGRPQGDHPASVMATFSLTYARMTQVHPAAAELLCLCVWFAAEGIPEELLVGGASHLGPVLGPVVADPYQLDELIAALSTFSLVQRQAEARTLSIHRLVQVVLRERMGEQERAQWQQRALLVLEALFPEPEIAAQEVWGQCERILPHALACVTRVPDRTGGQVLARLLLKVANYLRGCAQYEQAEPLYKRAVRIWEQQEAGSEHLQVAFSVGRLAFLYTEQGRYEQAEPLYKRAVHIWEQQKVGSKHPIMARLMNGLAVLYADRGEYEQAESLYQQALHILQQTLGPEHPQVAAYPLHNLAYLYTEQGRYERAEMFYQEALRILEQKLGLEHPWVAEQLNGLANIREKQGRYEQAELFYQEALRIFEQGWGPEHPWVACPLNGLANLYTEQGNYKQAELLYERALAIRERLWQQHPETAQTLYDFATCSQKQGHFVKAASLYKRAIQIRSQLLGDLHPKTIETRKQYAEVSGKSQEIGSMARFNE